jgi:phytoene/squalene synthetase
VRTNAVFHYPREAFDEIIAGVAMDLDRSTYDDMAELRLYCYRVASCVGFLCVAIFGDQSPPPAATPSTSASPCSTPTSSATSPRTPPAAASTSRDLLARHS